jgi:hypothetical protein
MISVSVTQRLAHGSWTWSEGLDCTHCGNRTLACGGGLLSPDLRRQRLRANPAVLSVGVPSVALLRFLRERFQMTPQQLAGMKRVLPGRFVAGTAEEMEFLAAELGAIGVEATIEQRTTVEEAVPDLATLLPADWIS